MYLFHFHLSFLLALVIVSSIVSVAAHNANTRLPPSTFGELRNALYELGYECAEGLQKPQTSKPLHGISITSENKRCVKTVSIQSYLHHLSPSLAKVVIVSVSFSLIFSETLSAIPVASRMCNSNQCTGRASKQKHSQRVVYCRNTPKTLRPLC